MSNPLDELRKKLQAQKDNAKPTTGGDNALYPFWNSKTDKTTVVRFLPDGDTNNPYFWVVRRVIDLPFDGIVGRPEYNGKEVKVTVPCMKMYDHKLRCPILEVTSKYWKTELEQTARKYWPKRTFIMQGFVREEPEFIPGKEPTNKPENPIRRFSVTKTLFENIEGALLDPDMINMPTDYENGTDFRIMKTQKGEYANYQTSSFARRETALSDEEREAIDTYGLFNLNDYLPKRPDEDGIALIEEMFHASLNGQPYDPRWARLYSPYGIQFDEAEMGNRSAPAAPAPTQSAPAQSSTTQEPPFTPDVKSEEPASEPASDNTESVLARLRSEVNKNS